MPDLINALNATFGILFTLNATWTTDRYGRRFLLILGAIGMGICMIIVASVETQTPTSPDGAKSESVGIAIVFLLFLFIFFYKPSWGATIWIWTSEVFSMNVRAQAVGMASQTQNVANAIVNQFFPIFLEVSNSGSKVELQSILTLVLELWLLRLLYVCRHQLLACNICILL